MNAQANATRAAVFGAILPDFAMDCSIAAAATTTAPMARSIMFAPTPAKCTASRAMATMARTPVSYTHLDVYKRQVQQRSGHKQGEPVRVEARAGALRGEHARDGAAKVDEQGVAGRMPEAGVVGAEAVHVDAREGVRDRGVRRDESPYMREESVARLEPGEAIALGAEGCEQDI